VSCGVGVTAGNDAGLYDFPGGCFGLINVASFDVTATTMFFGDEYDQRVPKRVRPLCQYTVYGILALGSFLNQPQA